MSEIKVVAINDARPMIESGANVIERCQELSQMAREGLVTNVMIVAAMADGSMMRCWANDIAPFAMVGQLEVAKAEFMKANIEGM